MKEIYIEGRCTFGTCDNVFCVILPEKDKCFEFSDRVGIAREACNLMKKFAGDMCSLSCDDRGVSATCGDIFIEFNTATSDKPHIFVEKEGIVFALEEVDAITVTRDGMVTFRGTLGNIAVDFAGQRVIFFPGQCSSVDCTIKKMISVGEL